MSDQFFAHRPPSAGIHLLNDAQPERVESRASARADSKPLVSKKTARPRSKAKKTGLHS